MDVENYFMADIFYKIYDNLNKVANFKLIKTKKLSIQ